MASRYDKRLDAIEQRLNPEEIHAGAILYPPMASEEEIDEIFAQLPPATHPYRYIALPETIPVEDWDAAVAAQLAAVRELYNEDMPDDSST